MGVEDTQASAITSSVFSVNQEMIVGSDPIFDSVHIFSERVVIGAAITQWINGFLTMVQVFFLPTFYQTVYGYSAVKSGLLLLPLTVVQST